MYGIARRKVSGEILYKFRPVALEASSNSKNEMIHVERHGPVRSMGNFIFPAHAKPTRRGFNTIRSGYYNNFIRPFASGRYIIRSFSALSSESKDDFEHRIFGSGDGNRSDEKSKDTSFFQKLDNLELVRERSDADFFNQLGDQEFEDGFEGKLKDAAEKFDNYVVDDLDSYQYRPDKLFYSGTYDTQDLDLTKPSIPKYGTKKMAHITTKDVLEKADFRNVKFLSQFMTEAGIIVKRSKSGISAKAQRKVAREIKTARAFGLMPFISMGTKEFVPGRSVKEDPESTDLFQGRLTNSGPMSSPYRKLVE